MAVKADREYRSCTEFRAVEPEDDKKFIVEGYASTYEPYVLYDDGKDKIFERIDKGAFDNADMTDVLFLYNHEGAVLARQKNGSLELSVDDHGLKVRADLGGSEKSRQMYEEIKSGLIDQMSFAFTIAEDKYDKKSSTRIIKSFRKLYDVSAVSIPANPTTEISARAFCDGVIAEAQAERLAAEERERKVKILKLMLEVQQ